MIACWVVIVINVLTLIAIVLSGFLICTPLKAFLNLEMQKVHCGNRIKLELWQGIWNLLMDLAVVILPMPVLWKLQMPRNRKVGLSILFGMGVM